MNDPIGGPNGEFWLRRFGTDDAPPAVLIGTDDPIPLPDADALEVLQVPLEALVDTVEAERPDLVAVVATADQLAASAILAHLGERASPPVVVLTPGTLSGTQVARLLAPVPADLVALPSAHQPDGGDRIGLASLRARLRDQLGDQVPRERTEDAELCLTELVANAARHGEGEPSVTVSWFLGRLRVTVQDRSPAWPSPSFPNENGGRGLRLVHLLSDAWGVGPAPGGGGDGGGKVIWFEVEALPRPETASVEALA